MASLNSIDMRKDLASGKVYQRADDTSIPLRIRYIGAAGTPSVNVTVATQVAMIDATASVAYTWASYATLGALADAINASGLWEAHILDGLRSDVTLNTFKTGGVIATTTDENGVTVWDLVHDNNIVTNTSVYCATVCLSPFFNFDAPKGHRVHAIELSYNQDVGTAAANSVRLYVRNKNGTETQVYGALSVDATTTTITWASGNGKISGGDNQELVFRVQDAGSITDQAANFIRIVGILE